MSIIKGLLIVIVPFSIFFGFSNIMLRITGAHLEGGEPPLFLCYKGYDVKTVASIWSTFDTTRLAAERRFLIFDLVFPLVYCTGFLGSMLYGRTLLEYTFSPLWIIIPLGIVVIGDWTENLVQLHQLKRWTSSGETPDASCLQAGWICCASWATIIKLWVFMGVFLALIVLAGLVIFYPTPKAH